MEVKIVLAGRQWLKGQNNDTTNLKLKKVAGIFQNRCQRCNSLVKFTLPNGKKYCRVCIGLGRICEGDFLYQSLEQIQYPPKENLLSWQGELTLDQKQVSQDLLNSLKQRRNHLVHAVTGAGKTEMLFETINFALCTGKRVGVATPRIDVVNELFPRFQAAFESVKIGKYHGKEYFEARDEQLIICTTHQLLKFYQAFDLLIIDEVDSFPYRNNLMLYYGTKNAIKEKGVIFYLTATPDHSLLIQAKSNKIGYSILKHRFHGGKLPVPQEKMFVRPFIKNKRIHPKLVKEIRSLLTLKKPVLVFVPKIVQIPVYEKILKHNFSKLRITGVHAQDEYRQEKILDFRQGKFDLLLTTTILERGVTFKSVQVIVVAADDPIYTTPSLVQIAGRVGRNKADKTGNVIFCYHRYTKEIKEAKRKILEMNR
ncbi:DEAD/DEAH box helicase [Lactobacillus sp. PV012]|uniref:DEAD/DEAH box helicase n=1 Tax=Lactobacillus sp. PV012 TaxID=2594494 RepID=UPI003A102C30